MRMTVDYCECIVKSLEMYLNQMYLNQINLKEKQQYNHSLSSLKFYLPEIYFVYWICRLIRCHQAKQVLGLFSTIFLPRWIIKTI